MKQAGRIVIITGAAGGIGPALAGSLAADGYTVVAVDLPGKGVLEMADGLGLAHRGLEFDVSREEDIRALCERTERQFGQVGVLINNAAMGPTMAATVDTAIDAFRRVLAVNLIGPVAMAREAARRMGPGAVIINRGSMAGVLSNPKRNAYAASMTGLISFTKSLAWQYASCGIRVAAVAPAYPLRRRGVGPRPATRHSTANSIRTFSGASPMIVHHATRGRLRPVGAENPLGAQLPLHDAPARGRHKRNPCIGPVRGFPDVPGRRAGCGLGEDNRQAHFQVAHP